MFGLFGSDDKKKKYMIGGGIGVVVILVIILIVAFSGKSATDDAAGDDGLASVSCSLAAQLPARIWPSRGPSMPPGAGSASSCATVGGGGLSTIRKNRKI